MWRDEGFKSSSINGRGSLKETAKDVHAHPHLLESKWDKMNGTIYMQHKNDDDDVEKRRQSPVSKLKEEEVSDAGQRSDQIWS